jgi:hypothetical protein
MIQLRIRIPDENRPPKEEFLRKLAIEKLNKERKIIVERITMRNKGLFPPLHPNTIFRFHYLG